MELEGRLDSETKNSALTTATTMPLLGHLQSIESLLF